MANLSVTNHRLAVTAVAQCNLKTYHNFVVPVATAGLRPASATFKSYLLIGPPFESSILIGQNDVAKSSSALHHAPVKPYILIGQIPAEKFQRPASRHASTVLRSDWSTLCRKVPAPGITPCPLAPRVLIGP